MSKYKPYPSYKDSGVEWLGDIPSGWKTTQIKHIGKLKSGAGFPHEYQGFQDNDIQFHKVNALSKANKYDYLINGDNTISTETAHKLSAYIFPKQTIVFAKVGAALLLARIRLLNNISCIDNNMMGFVVLKKFNVNFMKYSMNTIKFDYIVNSGAIPALNESQIGSIKFSLPPPTEQKAIADFLDNATSKIDTLIAKQQELIKLLKEKRQAVISHAVTKGLDPTVEFKDSGVDWLGDVPSGWLSTKIKNMLSTPITDGPHETPEFLDDGIPFISAEAISKGFINFDKIRGYISIEANQKYSEKYSPMLNDVYMIKSGATTGVTAIVKDRIDFNIWSPLAVFRSSSKLHPCYLLNYLRSTNFQKAVELYWTYGTQQNIGMNVLENLHITIPPLIEQQAIAIYLDDKTTKIDTLVDKATQSIALLKEKRVAIISSAVTGKIDVRGVV